jgi:hypothetical protein
MGALFRVRCPLRSSILLGKVSNGRVVGLVPGKNRPRHTHHRTGVGVSLTPLRYGLPTRGARVATPMSPVPAHCIHV